MKTCAKCGLEKPLDEFYNDKSTKDGKTARCQECCKESSRTYGADKRAEDPTTFYFYHKEWIATHGREQYAGYELDRANTEARRDYLRVYNAEYRAEHPDEFSAYGMVRRARKIGASVGEAVVRSVVAERDGWVCQLCHKPIDPNGKHKLPDGSYNPWYLHIDHKIPLSKGGEHSYANVQASHARCNLSKNAKVPE